MGLAFGFVPHDAPFEFVRGKPLAPLWSRPVVVNDEDFIALALFDKRWLRFQDAFMVSVDVGADEEDRWQRSW